VRIFSNLKLVYKAPEAIPGRFFYADLPRLILSVRQILLFRHLTDKLHSIRKQLKMSDFTSLVYQN